MNKKQQSNEGSSLVLADHQPVLKEFGEPIELAEYLEHYELIAKYLLKELTFSDWQDDRMCQLFSMEMIQAETQWQAFYERELRPPDYSFLQNEITTFGIERLPLFNGRAEELSVDNFVHSHIEQLKAETLLSPLQFESVDLTFIERYTRNKATNYFNQRNHYVKNYERFRISTNQTMQRAGYKQLKQSFVTDPVIKNYQKKEVVQMAVNDERAAEFILDGGKNLLRQFVRSVEQKTQAAVLQTGKAINRGVKMQLTTGKQRYGQLKKQGALEHVDINKTDLKPLVSELKRYKLDFAVKQNKETGKIHVFFKARDRDTLNVAFENILHKFSHEKAPAHEQQQNLQKEQIPTEKKEQKKAPTLTEKLDKLEVKAQEINQQREQTKTKTKEKSKGQER